MLPLQDLLPGDLISDGDEQCLVLSVKREYGWAHDRKLTILLNGRVTYRIYHRHRWFSVWQREGET